MIRYNNILLCVSLVEHVRVDIVTTSLKLRDAVAGLDDPLPNVFLVFIVLLRVLVVTVLCINSSRPDAWFKYTEGSAHFLLPVYSYHGDCI